MYYIVDTGKLLDVANQVEEKIIQTIDCAK